MGRPEWSVAGTRGDNLPSAPRRCVSAIMDPALVSPDGRRLRATPFPPVRQVRLKGAADDDAEALRHPARGPIPHPGEFVKNRFDVDDLLAEYRRGAVPRNGSLVTLSGMDGLDGYNPSAPAPDGAHPYAYVRVEYRHDEFSSWSVPFRQESVGAWSMDPDLPMLSLQDPFVTVVGTNIVVGGVRVVARTHDFVHFRTSFWRGESLRTLAELTQGPLQMKDTRLIELDDGTMGVFSRPLGGAAGRGKIAYTEAPGLEGLTPDLLAGAQLLDCQPLDKQWWGPNDVCRLPDGKLGVLGHVAKLEGTDRHYYACAFTFDRHRRQVVAGPRIIADRSKFPPFPPKRPDLEDVVFPGHFDRKQGLLFAGLSDSSIGYVSIDDPFLQPPSN